MPSNSSVEAAAPRVFELELRTCLFLYQINAQYRMFRILLTWYLMPFFHVVSCSAAPGRIQYPCIAQTGCADGTSTDLTKDVVRSTTLSLVPDDSEIDGHRECQILLRPLQGSMCKFNITRGSTQLRVTDDESECSVTFIAIFTCCNPLSNSVHRTQTSLVI